MKIPRRHTRLAGIKIPQLKKWIKPLRRKIRGIKDPRGRQGQKYPLGYVLELYLTSCLCGYCDCANAVEFLRGQQDVIAEFIPAANWLGIPSHDCFCDVLSVVGKDEMESMLDEFNKLCRKAHRESPDIVRTTAMKWEKVEEEGRHRNGTPFQFKPQERRAVVKHHICVDGKASRGATDKKRNANTPYTGGFYDAGAGLYTDVVDIPNGKEEGEATVIRQALASGNLLYRLITADAIHASQETMATIVASRGEFLLRLKRGSHPAQFELILDEMEVSRENAEIDRKRLEAALSRGETVATPELDRYQEKKFIETDKSRVTKTVVRTVVDDHNICSEYSPYISQLVYLKSQMTELIKSEDGSAEEKVVSEYECCFVASCILDVNLIYRFIKEHWSIESSHWILDNVFNEDRSTGRTGNQVYNRAVFKRLAYNLLKMLEVCVEETKGKSSKEKFIFLRSYFYLALMMVEGFSPDYCHKMAMVYEKRKEAYLKEENEVDFSNIQKARM